MRPAPSDHAGFYPFLFGTWAAFDARTLGILCVMAALIVGVRVELAKAYQSPRPQVIATFDYAYLIFAAFWGFVFFREVPDIREVTLIEAETLEALERDFGITLRADQLRRNLTVSGIPLNHLVGRRFFVGDMLLLGGRLNTPCRCLDLGTGQSVCDLLVHRSGLNCSILCGGRSRSGTVFDRGD